MQLFVVNNPSEHGTPPQPKMTPERPLTNIQKSKKAELTQILCGLREHVLFTSKSQAVFLIASNFRGPPFWRDGSGAIALLWEGFARFKAQAILLSQDFEALLWGREAALF
jgi:hypothetical protein